MNFYAASQRLLAEAERYKPPAAVAKAAKRGLDARKAAPKSKKGGLTSREAGKQGIGSGVQRASNLANGDSVDLETVKMMHGFFSRHEGNYRKAKAKGLSAAESPAIQAWLLWGGSAGKRWAAGIVNSQEQS